MRSAIVLKPFIILGFHRTLVKRKVRIAVASERRGKAVHMNRSDLSLGRSTRTSHRGQARAVLLGEQATDDVLVDVNTAYESDLLGNPLVQPNHGFLGFISTMTAISSADGWGLI